MKLPYKKSSTYHTVVITILVITIIICSVYIFVILKPKPTERSTDPTPTTQQHSADNNRPPQEQASTDMPQKEGLPKSFEGDNQPQDTSTLSGNITHLGKTDSHLRIRTTIHQALSSGSCVLTITGPSTIQLTSDIIQNPSSSSCEGFDVPLSRLGSGTWSIRIKLSSNSKVGLITGEVRL